MTFTIISLADVIEKLAILCFCIFTFVFYRKLKDVWSLLLFIGLIVITGLEIEKLLFPFFSAPDETTPIDETTLASLVQSWNVLITRSFSVLAMLLVGIGFGGVVYKSI